MHILHKEKRKHFFVYVLPIILFFYLGTHAEISQFSTGSGLVLLIRNIAGLLLIISLVIIRRYRLDFTKNNLLIISGIASYFLIVNLFDVGKQSFVALGLIVLGLLLAAGLGRSGKKALLILTTGYLSINLFGFLLASIIYLLTGDVIDLHGIVFPYSEARIMLSSGFMRLTGFQIEPGSYSAFMYIVVIIRSLLIKKIGTTFHVIVAVSCLFTFSAWAAIAIAILLAAMLMEFLLKLKKSVFNYGIVWLVVLVSVSIIPAFYLKFNSSEQAAQYEKHLEKKMLYSGSSSSKQSALNSLLRHYSTSEGLGRPMSSSFCSFCKSPQDLGTIPNMTYFMGLGPTAILVVVIVYRLFVNYNLSFIVALMPVAVSKAYFYDPLIWLIIGILIFHPRQKKQGTRLKLNNAINK